MEDFQPNIDLLPGKAGFQTYPAKRPWFKARRLLIFIITFSVASAGSLFYCYSRPALYRSSATLLTSAMTAIDATLTSVDPQQAAIEREVLLGRDLLSQTLTRLNASLPNQSNSLSLPQLQAMLSLVPVEGTQLIEIRAEGSDPVFLPSVINTWIDTYFDAREKEVRTVTSETTHIIEDDLNVLSAKVNAKRQELIQFRKNNNILSVGRDENAALARLNGITESLNHALEAETKTKTNLEAVKLAIADGQPVVPEQDQGILQDLEKRRQELKAKQDKMLHQFTQEYINLQPALKNIPNDIDKIELEILHRVDYGKKIVLTEAIKDYAAAKETVKQVRADLEEHKNTAAEFTTQFATHETLKTDLESLERLYRQTQERLVQLQANQKEKYPQVTIINNAFEPETPISPQYNRDALFAVASSFLLGLFVVWLVEYLNKAEEPPAMVTLSGVHVYPNMIERRGSQQTQPYRPITHKPLNTLPNSAFRELTGHELKVLYNNASLKGKQMIGCLLSGLSPLEVASLTYEQLDFTSNTIRAYDPKRVLPLHEPVKALFAQSGGAPTWDANLATVTDEIRVSLLCAAIDCGLPHPAEISAAAIYQSYITYLIRQGIRLDALESIVGPLEPSMMMIFSVYTTAHKDLGVDEVELLHPALT